VRRWWLTGGPTGRPTWGGVDLSTLMAGGPHLRWHVFSCLLDSSQLGFDVELISLDSGLQI
jgi:hypothetical protein